MLKFGNFVGFGGLIKVKINHENFIKRLTLMVVYLQHKYKNVIKKAICQYKLSTAHWT